MAIPAAAPYYPADSDSDTDSSEGPVNPPNSLLKTANTYEEQQKFRELDEFRIQHYSKKRKIAKLQTYSRAFVVLATLPISLPFSFGVKVFRRKLEESEVRYQNIALNDEHLDVDGNLKLRRISNGRTSVICHIAFSALVRNFTTQGIEQSLFLEQENNFALDYVLNKKREDEINRTEYAHALVLPLILRSIESHDSNPESKELLSKSHENAQKVDISKNKNKIDEVLNEIGQILIEVFSQKKWQDEIPVFNGVNNKNAIEQLLNTLLEDRQFKVLFEKLKDSIPLTITRNIGYPNEDPTTPAQRQVKKNHARMPLSFVALKKNHFHQSILRF